MGLLPPMGSSTLLRTKPWVTARAVIFGADSEGRAAAANKAAAPKKGRAFRIEMLGGSFKG